MFASLKTATVSLFCSLVLLSGSVTAATVTTTETWDFKTNKSATNGNAIEIFSRELNNKLLMTGWTTQTSSNTAQIVAANNLVLTTSLGVQIYNNHDKHGVDNIDGYDFILLEFPSPTELISLTNTWSNQPGYDWISVASLNTNPFSSKSLTWGQIASSSMVTASASYKHTGMNNEFIFADKSPIISGTGINNTTSKFWLIGAYNSAFNGGNCGTSCFGDSLKFGSITTKTTTTTPDPTPVPTPGTLSLFAVALLGLSLNKRRKAK